MQQDGQGTLDGMLCEPCLPDRSGSAGA
jgi:hypothetical protein